MAFGQERPSPGGSHSAYLETKDAVYQLIASLDGLFPRVTSRRERRELLELFGRLERIIIEIMLVEELEDEFWEPTPLPDNIPPAEASDGSQSEESPPGS